MFSPVVFNLPINEQYDTDQDGENCTFYQLYVSRGSSIGRRYVNEWHFTCSNSCRAHLVNKLTGEILKRYDVIVDPTR